MTLSATRQAQQLPTTCLRIQLRLTNADIIFLLYDLVYYAKKKHTAEKLALLWVCCRNRAEV